MTTMKQRSRDIFRVTYYPRDEEQKSKSKQATFFSLREAKQFIKQGLETASICSFYQLETEYGKGQ